MACGKQSDSKYIGVGLALGAGIGAALNNLAIGVAIGLAIGAGLAARARSNPKPGDLDDSGDEVNSTPDT